MAYRHDIELQIRLAELQADIQINLTIAFGFFAGFIALVIGFMQIFYTLPWEESFMVTKIGFAVLIIILIVGCWICAFQFANKVTAIRKEFEKLRKEYSW